MIHFSLSSVLMTVLVSNLLLVLISLLFRNEDVLAKIGFRLTAIFCIITLIRLVLPLELPFAKTVILPKVLSDVLFISASIQCMLMASDICLGHFPFGVACGKHPSFNHPILQPPEGERSGSRK